MTTLLLPSDRMMEKESEQYDDRLSSIIAARATTTTITNSGCRSSALLSSSHHYLMEQNDIYQHNGRCGTATAAYVPKSSSSSSLPLPSLPLSSPFVMSSSASRKRRRRTTRRTGHYESSELSSFPTRTTTAQKSIMISTPQTFIVLMMMVIGMMVTTRQFVLYSSAFLLQHSIVVPSSERQQRQRSSTTTMIPKPSLSSSLLVSPLYVATLNTTTMTTTVPTVDRTQRLVVKSSTSQRRQQQQVVVPRHSNKVRVVRVEQNKNDHDSDDDTIINNRKESTVTATPIHKKKQTPPVGGKLSSHRREKRQRRIPKGQRRSPDENEFDWLHWVYTNWKDVTPGKLNEWTLLQIVASIPKWSRRKSLQSAIRAEQALERLIVEAEAKFENDKRTRQQQQQQRDTDDDNDDDAPPIRHDSSRSSSSTGVVRIDEQMDSVPVSQYLTLPSFNAAMDAYAKIGKPDGAQRILRRMETLRQSEQTRHDQEQQHTDDNDDDNDDDELHFAHLRPDVFSMSILATAWAKSGSPDSADQVEALLKFMQMKKMEINTNVYNTILHAIAVSQRIDKALRVEDIVRSMTERAINHGEDCYPDVYTFQALIQAWANTRVSGAPQRCEQILRRMDDEADKANDESLRPNAYCYTTVIHAFARSYERERARNASRLINELKQRWDEGGRKKSMKPNVRTYTAALNACTRPIKGEKGHAFEVAQTLMDELSEGTYGQPNFLSYSAFLFVCESSLESGLERDNVVEDTFEKCRKDRMVGQTVLQKLFSAASPELFESLVGDFRDDDGKITLPKSWFASIRGERPGGQVFPVTAGYSRKMSTSISESSHRRLQAVERLRHNSDGIKWTSKPLSRKKAPY